MNDQALFELTPMATLGLALCLAYLELDRFHYRQSFQMEARRVLEDLRLRQEGLDESRGDTIYYLGLKLLAHWSNPREIREIKKSIKENVQNGSPFGWRIRLYRLLFEPPLPRSMWSDQQDRLKLGWLGTDRLITTILAFLSLVFLVFGRAHLLKILSWDILAYLFDDKFVSTWWIILLLSLLFPIVIAPIGEFVLRGIRRNIQHTYGEFKKFLDKPTEGLVKTGEEFQRLYDYDDLQS